MNLKNDEFPVAAALFLAAAIIFLLLVLQSVGLYPSVMSDEYLSSMFARLLPLSEIARRPGYIYSAIYRVTNIFGDGFLEGARMLNALFFVSAMPFIYGVAKRYCTRRTAFAVAVMALLAPVKTYTALFMPESLYFLAFWVFTWIILRQDSRSGIGSWCLVGMSLGIWSLIKPHALFLLPSGVLCVLFFSIRDDRKWVAQALLRAVLFVICAFSAKLVISYVLAGETGLTLFGTEYSATTGAEPIRLERILELLMLFSENIRGHILGLCLMFGMPLAAMLAALCSANSSKDLIADKKLMFYAALVVANLVLVTCLFTANIAGIGYETIERLHMRYYSFTFPLLLIIAGSIIDSVPNEKRSGWKAVFVSLIGVAILFALYTRMEPFTPNFADSPEVRGFTANRIAFYILGSLSFAALVVWFFAPKSGARLYLYLVLPLTILVSSIELNKDLRWRIEPNVYDRAGLFAKQNLSDEERSRVLVVGPNPADCMRVLFHLDNPHADWLEAEDGSPYCVDSTDLKDIVLLVGDYPVIGSPAFGLATREFQLISSKPLPGWRVFESTLSSVAIDFKKEFRSQLVSVGGLSGVEPGWGTWSDSQQVVLEFHDPLPEKFRLYLVAAAFGPNAGKQTRISIGNSTNTVIIDAAEKTITADFENYGRSSVLTFDIPEPASPRELGEGPDERKLGIRFVKLHIVPVD